jgi:hypothetical protein
MNIASAHLSALHALGYTEAEARFLYIVATHSGYFVARQFLAFTHAHWGYRTNAFWNKLHTERHARTECFPKSGTVYHLYSRRLYRQIDRENIRNRRQHEIEFIQQRIGILNFVLAHPQWKYLETEPEKVSFFCNLKTQNGERDIDLCTSLAKALREFIGVRKSGLVFQTSTGSQLLQANTLQDSLHPILKELEHIKGGFNIFRRFRITLLGKSDCPDALKHFWSGHAHRHVSERYTKLLREREFRLNWAEKIGLGFELPEAKVGQLIEFRKAV